MDFEQFISPAGIDYKELFRSAWPVNRKEANELAKFMIAHPDEPNNETRQMLKKIDNYILNKKSKDLPIEVLHAAASCIDVDKGYGLALLSHICKHPSKQNLPERCLHYYLSKHPCIVAVDKKGSGGSSLYIEYGQLNWRKAKDATNEFKKLKSVDLFVKMSLNKREVFLFHKYTEDSGGSQDNQKNDLRHWLENVQGISNGYVCVAVCDGTYLSCKIDDFKKEFGSHNIIITSTKEIYNVFCMLNKQENEQEAK